MLHLIKANKTKKTHFNLKNVSNKQRSEKPISLRQKKSQVGLQNSMPNPWITYSPKVSHWTAIVAG
jgi:hypothetical protein